MGFLTRLFGDKSTRDNKALQPLLQKTLDAYESIKNLDIDSLRHKTVEFKEYIRNYVAEDEAKIAELKANVEANPDMDLEKKNDIYEQVDKLEKKLLDKVDEALDHVMPEAFAVLKETARRFKENDVIEATATDLDRDLAAKCENVRIEGDRVFYDTSWVAGGNMIRWDMVHYDVQIIGGIVLHQGKIAEMATGEGKTLVATLPVYLRGLSGRGVHVVTVNDYLAKRDSEWMGPLYNFLGLTIDCIDKHQPNSAERRAAYNSDITYGTNNEFGFDYLRDNMTRSPEEMVQRPRHYYAIVDEVDSVLIDDARTPLIISGPIPHGEDQEFIQLKPDVVKLYEAQKRLVTQCLAEAKKILNNPNATEDEKSHGADQLFRAFHGLPKNTALIKFLSEEGMKSLLLKTEGFYMQEQNKNMHIIDDELYFVIDEKLNTVVLTDKGNEELAKAYNDPSFFVIPDVGSEIAELEKSGLSDDEKVLKKSEILRVFSEKSDRVHTVQQLLKAYTLFEKDVDYVVIDNKVKIVDEQTGRIMEGRRWSDGLHQAVEAKENVDVEAATQTYATITLQNYFRMYHKLSGMTGTAETEAGEFWEIYKLDVVVIPTNRPVIRNDQDDLIYRTKKDKYNAVIAIIEDLIGQGRPVLVGTTSVEISELLSRMLKLRGIKHQVLNAKQHAREAEVVAHAGEKGTVTIATNMAGRGTDIKLTDEVRAAGGLAIIGTERHDSRRVDRQLRGRAGRQGDPGSSIFFISMEDDLMRVFGGERIAKVVDNLGMKEGESLQSKMLSGSIERAQRKVEENNFGIRKNLVEYDDVMNSQREVVYTKRRSALTGERIDVDVLNMATDYCDIFVDKYKDADFETFKEILVEQLGVDATFDEQFYDRAKKRELADRLCEDLAATQQRRNDTLIAQAWPIVNYVYEKKRMFYQNIALPITDGRKVFNILVDLRKAYETKGKELVRAVYKTVTLRVIDEYWKNHLRDMDDLKQSVQNASYEQKDPKLMYKTESFGLFITALEGIYRDVLSTLLRMAIHLKVEQAPEDVATEAHEKRTDMSRMQTSRPDLVTNSSEAKSNAPIRVEKKVGRNDPCPCGSGKKYKNCHGKAEA